MKFWVVARANAQVPDMAPFEPEPHPAGKIATSTTTAQIIFAINPLGNFSAFPLVWPATVHSSRMICITSMGSLTFLLITSDDRGSVGNPVLHETSEVQGRHYQSQLKSVPA